MSVLSYGGLPPHPDDIPTPATPAGSDLLRRLDDCDCCGRWAVVVVKRLDQTLSFCGHDFRKYEVALTVDGWYVHETTCPWVYERHHGGPAR